MKKPIIFILALYYLTATIGLAVSVHYCHGNVEAIGVFSEAAGCCEDAGSCCACCLEEEYVVKADVGDQLAVSNKFDFNPEDASGMELVAWNIFQVTGPETASAVYSFYHNPRKPPAWLLYCNLTFYG